MELQATIQIPGIVVPNAYREVRVTPIANGILTKAHVEVGTVVKRGAPLMTIFSVEFAEEVALHGGDADGGPAEARADQRAHRDRGRQPSTDGGDHGGPLGPRDQLEAAQQRLLLLGFGSAQVQALKSPSQVVSTVAVPAPIDG